MFSLSHYNIRYFKILCLYTFNVLAVTESLVSNSSRFRIKGHGVLVTSHGKGGAPESSRRDDTAARGGGNWVCVLSEKGLKCSGREWVVMCRETERDFARE